MSEGDPGHIGTPADPPPRRSGRWLRRTTAGLVVAVLASALLTYRFDLGGRWFGFDGPSPVTEPAQVLPPAGLTLPAAARPAPVARAATAGTVDGAAVRRAVAGLVARKKLGPHVDVAVAQMSDGKVVYRHGSGRVTPASTMKMLTTVAALQELGPEHRFTTSVVATPQSPRIVLVGGGDPLLARAPSADGGYPARADLDTLARATARSLKAIGRGRVRLGYDTSLFSGPSVNPHWEPSYIPDGVISPVTPLWVDEGRVAPGKPDRSDDPAAAAARVFAAALGRRGITVQGRPARTVAPTEAEGGQQIAAVRSAPLAEIVQHIVEVSDNEGAEILAHQVAVARGLQASFAGGAQAVRATLRGLGVDTRGDVIHDGSGLSRQDRLAPATLLSVIRTASDDRHPRLRSAVANLPVAGFTGSLASRFGSGAPAGRGRVRAKTGTLTGVHGLTGTVTSTDGAVMAFVAIADRVRPLNTLDARQDLDELAAALAGCTCATTP